MLLPQYHSLTVFLQQKVLRSGKLMTLQLLVPLKACRIGGSLFNQIGPEYGYLPNPRKTWVVTKHAFLDRARQILKGLEIQITTEGRPYLGALLGTQEYMNKFMIAKVDEWTEELVALSKIANVHPHAAYAAMTHGLIHRLDEKIASTLIPFLTGRPPPGPSERKIWHCHPGEGAWVYMN